MKAVLCKAFGSPDTLVIEDVPSPPVPEGFVKIKIHACGVNFPDVLMVQGLYQSKPPFPFSPGLEFAGEVIELGEGVGHLTVGQRVIGITEYGAFAEEIVVPGITALPMPDNMSYEAGAAFPITYGTSHVALSHRGKLQAGETLLVLGAAGGVGLTAVELGTIAGATVIAAASTQEKLDLAKSYGADYGINYIGEDLRNRVKEITQGRYADVIYDPVGGDTFDTAIRCVAWEGRYLVIGFASGRIPDMPANLVLLKNSSLVGVFWGNYLQKMPQVIFESFQQLFTLYAQGKLKPAVTQTYPLEQAADALTAMMERRSKGKLVLIP